jgi:curved DNA-binding protein CbpA
MKNHYRVLRLPNFSTSREIRQAYLKLSKLYHPDLNNGNEFFNSFFIEIKESYDFLMNENNKLKFDDLLKYNPEMFVSNELSRFENNEFIAFKNDKPKGRLYTILISAISLITVLLILYFIKFLFKNGVNSTSNYTDKNYLSIQNSIADSTSTPDTENHLNMQESNILMDSLFSNNTNSLQNTSQSNYREKYAEENSNQKINNKTNWISKVSAEINGSSLLIINKNPFKIFRVNLNISYRDDDQWMKLDRGLNSTFTKENHPFTRTETHSWFNIQPGITTLIIGDSKLKYVYIESCELQ